jgi:glycerol-3-phosphate O-acyltransferase
MPDEPASHEHLIAALNETSRLLLKNYTPGRDRHITPGNVYQPGNKANRPAILDLLDRLLLPGSRIDGLEHLDLCLAQLDAGRRILFLVEHAGNFDVPAFYALLRREAPRYQPILERLIYIAGRKLNEESELVKMYTEIFSRLVIVPRRELPTEHPEENDTQRAVRIAKEKEAAAINRAAFRKMAELKRRGHIFVLFPLGGRWKEGEENLPVRETTSYLKAFDFAYPISMQGNPLPATAGPMASEVPVRARVVFHVGAPITCDDYLAASHLLWEASGSPLDFEQFTVNRVMDLLEELHTRPDAG